MTVIESYRQAYAAKNKALKDNLKVQVDALKAKQTQKKDALSEALRSAYVSYVQNQTMSAQQNKSEGRVGGAAENQARGLTSEHHRQQQTRRDETAADIAEIQSDIRRAKADLQKKIDDNDAALEQKVQAQILKEEQAAIKAAASAAKAAVTADTRTKNYTIKLMNMGIYRKEFASILGITDKEVRDYIKNKGKKKTDTIPKPDLEKVNGYSSTTTKPPLR